jgi:hypothetical protein
MNLFDASKWELIDETTLSNSFQLANYQLPILLSRPVVGIYITTPNRKPTWFAGGWARQYVGTGLIDSGVNWKSYSKKLILGKNVIVFPQDFTSYSLQINLPSYFKSAFVSTWQFTGEVDSTESVYGEVAKVISDTAKLSNDVRVIAEQVANLLTIINAIKTIVGG